MLPARSAGDPPPAPDAGLLGSDSSDDLALGKKQYRAGNFGSPSAISVVRPRAIRAMPRPGSGSRPPTTGCAASTSPTAPTSSRRHRGADRRGAQQPAAIPTCCAATTRTPAPPSCGRRQGPEETPTSRTTSSSWTKASAAARPYSSGLVAARSGTQPPLISLPPCGGGSGWGVVPWGARCPLSRPPPPTPPHKGGGEECAAPSPHNDSPLSNPRPCRLALGTQIGVFTDHKAHPAIPMFDAFPQNSLSELARHGDKHPGRFEEQRLSAGGLGALVHAAAIDGEVSEVGREKLHAVIKRRFELDEAANRRSSWPRRPRPSTTRSILFHFNQPHQPLARRSRPPPAWSR